MKLTTVVAGQELSPVRVEPISRAILVEFANASGDRNPVHLDSDVARTAGFGDVIAHGMLSMAYLGRLLTAWMPQAGLRSFDTRFVAITPLGSEPVCSGHVRSIEETDGERRAILDLVVRLTDGTVTLTGEAVVSLTGSTKDLDL